MELTAFSRLGCVFMILACGVSVPRCVSADESLVTPPDVIEETFGSARDQGRLAWAILEAIEQHHIAPPPRQALVEVITRAFTGIKKHGRGAPLDKELLERRDADFLQCQCANEMADVFERVEGPTPDSKRFIADITSGFAEILDEFRLIRAKDHDVEEQFRGNRYVGLGVTLSMDAPSHLPINRQIVPGGAADRGGLTPNIGP